jgi:hypothetical protein
VDEVPLNVKADGRIGMRQRAACNVEPYAYLLHGLTELPQHAPNAVVTDLLPFNFAELAAAARIPPC